MFAIEGRQPRKEDGAVPELEFCAGEEPVQAEDDEWCYGADQEAVGDGVEERFLKKALGALRVGVSGGMGDS